MHDLVFCQSLHHTILTFSEILPHMTLFVRVHIKTILTFPESYYQEYCKNFSEFASQNTFSGSYHRIIHNNTHFLRVQS